LLSGIPCLSINTKMRAPTRLNIPGILE
jgi:hypothetical protein